MKVLKMDEAFKLRPLISIIKVSEFLSLLDIVYAWVSQNFLNSILMIIICISAKSIFDKWLVLVIEFIWSDNNSMDCTVFLVNCGTDKIRICDSGTECILKFLTVPFLKIDSLVQYRRMWWSQTLSQVENGYLT